MSIHSPFLPGLCVSSQPITDEWRQFHGGPDKAIHGCTFLLNLPGGGSCYSTPTLTLSDCCSHYPTWQAEFPTAAERFRPGGFGENFVFTRMNERNTCIGDVVSVGTDGLRLQVSLPRQPCFKLNHRFQLKNFAPNTWKTSRTGWYYRVLNEGRVRAGDEAQIVERPHPDWTIERVQEYLYFKPDQVEKIEELAAIEEFGAECKGAFKRILAKQKAKAKRAEKEKEETISWRDFKLVEKTKETARITSFVFEAVEPLSKGEDLAPGAHVKVKLGNGLVRAYSVVKGENSNRFELGIALEDKSRGGSKYLHESINIGDVIQAGKFTSAVPLVESASHHDFVAGGVGVTAFLSLMETLRGINYSCTLHYAVRSSDETPFKERLEKLGSHVVLYDKAKGRRMDIPGIIKNMPFNGRINFCGPRRMMDEALQETKKAGLGDEEVHFEAFEADISGDPFEAVVTNRNDLLLKVGGEETLLEVLQKQFGDEIPSSCEVGNCGTCKLAVRDGRVEHRGTALTDAEKAESMLSCVSRGIGRIAIEI